jgi:hypothetical protein
LQPTRLFIAWFVHEIPILPFATQSSCLFVTQISRVGSISVVGQPLLYVSNEASFSGYAPRIKVDLASTTLPATTEAIQKQDASLLYRRRNHI